MNILQTIMILWPALFSISAWQGIYQTVNYWKPYDYQVLECLALQAICLPLRITVRWKNEGLSWKLNETNTELSQIRRFIAGCKEIIKTSTEANPEVMEVKKDRLLGTKLSESRRLAIYNKLVADKVKLKLN